MLALQPLAQEAPPMTVRNDAAHLYWLAFLLTGRRDVSVDIALETALLRSEDNAFFNSWMGAWARRVVIATALAEIRRDLAASAQRTKAARIKKSVSPRNWSLPADTTKGRIEQALLAMDMFPRAALLLSIFEGVRAADAATLLDADIALVKKGVAIGLSAFTANLAGKAKSAVAGFTPSLAWGTSN